ncbi:MAG: hypothetical protein KBA26_05010 [Candidatus Delongbacteria bacterium]|nr:hypothetical protein [Candidatus Delongbacteria bacterium]
MKRWKREIGISLTALWIAFQIMSCSKAIGVSDELEDQEVKLVIRNGYYHQLPGSSNKKVVFEFEYMTQGAYCGVTGYNLKHYGYYTAVCWPYMKILKPNSVYFVSDTIQLPSSGIPMDPVLFMQGYINDHDTLYRDPRLKVEYTLTSKPPVLF